MLLQIGKDRDDDPVRWVREVRRVGFRTQGKRERGRERLCTACVEDALELVGADVEKFSTAQTRRRRICEWGRNPFPLPFPTPPLGHFFYVLEGAQRMGQPPPSGLANLLPAGGI